MVHLSQFKSNLLAFFRLMISTNMDYVDVIYKGRLYRVSVEDLNQEVVKRRRPRSRSLIDKIEAKKCSQCKKLVLNGVCTNSLCASNTMARSYTPRKQTQPVA